VVHGKPVSGDFTIQVLITDGGTFQPRPERFGAMVRHEVLDGPVDESATLTGLGHPINRMDRGFRQDDVDAFAHGNENK
jgi:hypothetical protein